MEPMDAQGRGAESVGRETLGPLGPAASIVATTLSTTAVEAVADVALVAPRGSRFDGAQAVEFVCSESEEQQQQQKQEQAQAQEQGQEQEQDLLSPGRSPTTTVARVASGLVTGDAVEARSDETGPTQELVVEKEANDGAIWPGDVVFLMAHTGKCIDVQGDVVSARWPMHGPWQAFTIEKAAVPEEPLNGARKDSEAASESAEAEAVLLADGQGSAHGGGGAELTREQRASILGVLKVGAMMKRFQARGTAAAARPAPLRADAATSRLVAYAGVLSAGTLALFLLARRRVVQSALGFFPGAAGYEEAPAGEEGSARLRSCATPTTADVEEGQ
ncbi:unnamed protein product [Prorocentrum cordatum]|uniref:RING-type E3 ubiquitin transferase n=1 Tax=Prorocentrum cordatum TaxID=2364126 RepID=A0ABN9TBU0_9DINO|nr:unnamed protein product [Polarella glacialis]